MLAIGLLIFFAYVIGSVPSGYILGKISGIDVRSVGSGNIGATNVARALGKGRGGLTLLADAAKGYLPVFLALRLEFDAAALALIAVAAFLGHLYPLFLNFHGGKGVATALGALLALAPTATLVLIVVFVVAVLVSRIVSLGAIAAAMAAPVALWFFSQSLVFVAMGLFLGAMIILRHRGNIQRLLAGTEPRFGAR
jgi:glycerol-3-phosphate acyltransferase PlsY